MLKHQAVNETKGSASKATYRWHAKGYLWRAQRCKRMRMPGVEPGISRPQREVLTTILHTPGEAGYRSQYLSHAKRALYHLSYIPIRNDIHTNTITKTTTHTTTNKHDLPITSPPIARPKRIASMPLQLPH